MCYKRSRDRMLLNVSHKQQQMIMPIIIRIYTYVFMFGGPIWKYF